MIDYKILDVYDGDNVKGGVLQNIPAYLTVTFNIEEKTKYTFIAESPDGEITGNITGWANPVNNHHWRIPFLEQHGNWKIEIHLHFVKPVRMIRETIKVRLTPELFEYCLEYDDIEKDEYIAERHFLLSGRP